MDELALNSLMRGGHPGQRLDALLRDYAKATGEELRRPLTPEESSRVRLWMMRADNPWIRYSGPSQGGWVHSSVTTKAGFLQQKVCGLCEPLPLEGVDARPSFFPVSVPPFTKQNPKIKRVVHARVVEELKKTADRRADPRTWKGLPICATVVAAQAVNRKTIDADNAAKAILDTLQGTVITNDNAIQHVSAFRLKARETGGYYLIGLRPVYPLDADVVHLSAQMKDASPLMGLQTEDE
ncbi:RusA family crossover junction endodeoxyribonuclease [Streptomyces roseolus]|uniref:RusA family crossover junction endodeoxyribonuclease n=2 Tax=Streptomyces TaxID=1883 RepID=UPI00365A8738